VRTWKIGDVTVTRIVEATYEGLEELMLGVKPEDVLPIEWLQPNFITPAGSLKYSIHPLVIEAPIARPWISAVSP
jgi:hypothetical protein